ncbi:hypothetical protein HLB23_17230 [Nocardia uniformis]|uniref:DoxX family membrane protein n=1 Tax=Nocardia uniformis TaxID=53432 RepID=A0A849C9Q2_9NOCA|nr:hypothetical protein [Nocardia uniformis]NNH71589.1 hypothetical protein [Nocardia uniformis]
MEAKTPRRSRGRTALQALLGTFLLYTGTSHLTFLREDFRAQVPPWIPGDVDFIVYASGVVELLLGAALLLAWKQPRRALVGAVVAAFFVAIFPGNIAQLVEHRDAFGLDTDTKRALRLLFQPILIAWALWATDAIGVWRRRATAPRPT